MTTEAGTFWEEHYRDGGPMPARVNPLLAEVAAGLSPGRALDLACGAGGDTLWLAGAGWQVTAVDIAASAISRLADTARAQGFAERVEAQRHDLAVSFPAGDFDLISAQYFQTPFELPRAEILRKAAQSLRPDGLLLVVDHGSVAPWSWNQDADIHFATPDEMANELALDGRYRVERADMPRRQATGPGGQQAEVTDNVLLLRRVG